MKSQEIRVTIVGETVLLEGIVFCLENNPHINMQQLAGSNDILHPIYSFRPDVIIYPIGCPDIEEALVQLLITSDVRLIGLEIDCNLVTITDRHVHHSLSLDDFQKLIANASHDLVHPIAKQSPKAEHRERAGE